MPIIKSAKKQMRQNVKKRVRNFRTRDNVKGAIKAVEGSTKVGTKEEAAKMLQAAYKAIDTAAKKNILHPNNASRKKSKLAKLVDHMGSKKVVEEKKGKKKVAPKTKKEEMETSTVEESPAEEAATEDKE